jgi:hypothetical protein
MENGREMGRIVQEKERERESARGGKREREKERKRERESARGRPYQDHGDQTKRGCHQTLHYSPCCFLGGGWVSMCVLEDDDPLLCCVPFSVSNM